MKYIAAVIFASLSFATFAQSNIANPNSPSLSNGATNDSTSVGSTLTPPNALPTPPANCGSTSATWSVGGNTCSGVLPAAYNNMYSEAVSTADGFIGAASYQCSNGSFFMTGTPTCVVNNGGGSSGQSQFYTLTENNSQTANMKTPFTASEIDITLGNTVAPQWGGDEGYFNDGWPFITYNHLVTITNPAGNVIYQASFAPLGPTAMLRETNHGGGCFNTNGSTGGGCGYVKWFGQTSIFFDSARGYGGQNLTGGYTQTGQWGGSSNYNATYFPQLDSSQTGSIKIMSSIPGGSTVDIHTTATLQYLNAPSGVYAVNSTSQASNYSFQPAKFSGLAAQNGGFNSCGDERYCQDFQIQNQGSWEKNYSIKVVGTAVNPPTASTCPAFTMIGTYTNGNTCTGNFPVESVGRVDELDCTLTTNGNASTRSNYSTCQADGTQSPVSQVDH